MKGKSEATYTLPFAFLPTLSNVNPTLPYRPYGVLASLAGLLTLGSETAAEVLGSLTPHGTHPRIFYFQA